VLQAGQWKLLCCQEVQASAVLWLLMLVLRWCWYHCLPACHGCEVPAALLQQQLQQ
jgi:hypothetical protein